MTQLALGGHGVGRGHAGEISRLAWDCLDVTPDELDGWAAAHCVIYLVMTILLSLHA